MFVRRTVGAATCLSPPHTLKRPAALRSRRPHHRRLITRTKPLTGNSGSTWAAGRGGVSHRNPPKCWPCSQQVACCFLSELVSLTGESLGGTSWSEDGRAGTACEADELFTRPHSQQLSQAENPAGKIKKKQPSLNQT